MELRKIFLLLFLLFPLVNAEQLNPSAAGIPVKIAETEQYFVVGSSNMVRIFSKSGELIKFLNVDGLSDFAIDGDRIYVVTSSQHFPNIRAYSFPELENLWYYIPRMLVFDRNLVWQEKETKSWKVKLTSNGILVCSGYTLYLFDREGNVLNTFEAKNDVWDVAEDEDYIYLATQEGVVYKLDKSLNLKEKIKVCERFNVVDVIANKTLASISRSVWQVYPEAASCEDGDVVLLNSKKRIEVTRYSENFLNTYYSKIRRETAPGDALYKNVRMLKTPRGILAFSPKNLVLIVDEERKWSLPLRVYAASFYNDKIYVANGMEYGNEVIKVLDTNGNVVEELKVSALKGCSPSAYVIHAGKKGVLLASDCEIKLIGYSGNIRWYFPFQRNPSYLKKGDIYMVYSGVSSPFDTLSFYSLSAFQNNKLKWNWVLPKELREKGYIKDVKLLNDKVVLWFFEPQAERGKLIVLDVYTGKLLKKLNASTRTYAGLFDKYLLNSTFVNIVRNFNYSVFEGIPEEIFEGRIEDAVRIYDEESVRKWMEILNNLPLNYTLLLSFRDFEWSGAHHLMFSPVIRKLYVCDANGDGYDDLIVSTRDAIFVRDGRDLKELWLVDREHWRYDNEINRKYKKNFTADWLREESSLICVGDVNGDSKTDFFLINWGFFALLESNGSGYVVKWNITSRNVGWEFAKGVGDIDYDGVTDVLFPVWKVDAPPEVRIVSGKTGEEITRFRSHEFSFYPLVGDVNGDDKFESLLYFERYGAKLELLSPQFEWKYEKIERFHEVKEKYGIGKPATIVKDVDGDGISDVVFAIASDEGGVKLIFVNAKNDKIIKKVVIEKGVRETDEREWMYTNDIESSDELLFFSVPVPRWRTDRKGKVCMFNLTSGKVAGSLYREIRELVVDGNAVLGLGNNGEVVPIDLRKKIDYEFTVNNDRIRVRSEGYYIKIFVDNTLSAASDNEIEIRLPAGEHEISVSFTDEDGYERIFSHRVVIEGVPLTYSLNLALLALIACAAAWKVGVWKRQSKR